MFNPAAAQARCEAIVGARRARSQLMTDDPKLTIAYLALTDLPAALEALEEVREAWEFIEMAWTDSDVHQRHAPDDCDSCDAVWDMLMVIRDAVLRGIKEGE